MTDFLEWGIPTEDGDVTYFLLTKQGYETLLKDIPVNLGELANKLLQYETNNNLLKVGLDNLTSVLEDKTQQISNLFAKIAELEAKQEECCKVETLSTLEQVKLQYPNKTAIKALRENKLIEVAVSLGIDAKVSDLKADTVLKVLTVLNY